MIGAFRSFREIDETPVDTVKIPTLDELKKMVDAKRSKYCGGRTRCTIKVEVGYYEGGAGAYQTFLEPAVVFSITQRSELENGSALIAHRDAHYQQARFSSNETGAWVSEIADDTIESGLDSAIAADPEGEPHILHIVEEKNNPEPERLRYQHRVDGAWVTEDVVAEGAYTDLMDPAVAVDAHGRVHVVFRETWDSQDHLATRNTVRYARREVDGGWRHEVVYDIEGRGGSVRAGDEPSLVLDGDESPHVAFRHDSNQEIDYAVRGDDGTWSVEAAAEGLGDRARGISLALDGSGNAAISFLHETEMDAGRVTLELTTNASGTWESRTLDTCLYLINKARTSVAADPDGSLHISYGFRDEDNPGLRYITNKSGEWIRADIDTAGWVGQYNALELDRFGLVHIAYDGEDALWHARFPAGKTDAVLSP